MIPQWEKYCGGLKASSNLPIAPIGPPGKNNVTFLPVHDPRWNEYLAAFPGAFAEEVPGGRLLMKQALLAKEEGLIVRLIEKNLAAPKD